MTKELGLNLVKYSHWPVNHLSNKPNPHIQMAFISIMVTFAG
jgi:hypothetical protein